jgi:hypothetical protein
MKKCTIGKTHKWVWVKNTTTQKVQFGLRGNRAALSRKGIYACDCGEVKYGAVQTEL